MQQVHIWDFRVVCNKKPTTATPPVAQPPVSQAVLSDDCKDAIGRIGHILASVSYEFDKLNVLHGVSDGLLSTTESLEESRFYVESVMHRLKAIANDPPSFPETPPVLVDTAQRLYSADLELVLKTMDNIQIEAAVQFCMQEHQSNLFLLWWFVERKAVS
jgi:hypothetical protein